MLKFCLMAVLAVMAPMAGLGSAGAASAAEHCLHRLGAHQQVADGGGIQSWSVADLKKSGDVPDFPVAGQLWEATATVTAILGTSTPVIPNFAATSVGARYPALWQMASPRGISPATLTQGQTATGKIYFDVTSENPMAVTYTAGGARPLMWCCGETMMAMPMDACPCCANMKEPCPCCAGKM
nr:MPT63 family protein [Mycolicibacterium obuense]